MENFNPFSEILVYLVATVIVVPIFKYLKLSASVGFLVAGTLIGPHCLNFIQNLAAPQMLGEFGVLFLLFIIGLDLSLARISLIKRYVFGLGVLQVLVTALIISCIALIFKLSLIASIIIGLALALSSTAFVVQLLIDNKILLTRSGRIGFAVLLFQDLAIVPILIFITFLSSPQYYSLTYTVGITFIKALLVLFAVFILSRFAIKPGFRLIAKLYIPELFIASTLLVILGISWSMHFAGLSMTLGAFITGLIFAESEYRHQIEAHIKPYQTLLLGLFFISIGMTINLDIVKQNLMSTVGLVVGIMSLKTLVLFLLCKVFHLSTTRAIRISFLLAQSGEFGFIILTSAMRHQLLPSKITHLLLATISISMTLTPIMYYLANCLTSKLKQHTDQDLHLRELQFEPASNHVIIAGFGRVGQTIAQILENSHVPFVAFDIDQKIITRCRKKNLPVFFGDASYPGILHHANIDQANIIVITLNDRITSCKLVERLKEKYPDKTIIARAKDQRHQKELQEKGATWIVPEMIEASLQLANFTLRQLGFDEHIITASTHEYRARLTGVNPFI